MNEDFEYKEVLTGLPAERALDVAAVVANLVPLIGGPVSTIISGIAGGRKEQRILEVVQGISDDLHDFKSEVADEYVRTEEFQELLEKTLRRAAEERNEEKRRLYRNFLTTAIKHPGGNYDEQLRLVKTLEELSLDHVILLQALLMQPEQRMGGIGSPIRTLIQRIPSMSEARIEQLVNELNDRRLTSLSSLRVTMTSHGAANLQHAVTPLGRQLIEYIQGT